MKNVSWIALLIVSLNCFADENCMHDEHNFRCVKYLKNYDGDTVTFEIPNVHPLIGKSVPIRINGLDTPEVKGHHPCEKDKAIEAKNLVEQLLQNAKVIDLRNIAREKYFRILADVYVDGKNLKDIILEKNLAYKYHGETKVNINWCTFRKTASEDK